MFVKSLIQKKFRNLNLQEIVFKDNVSFLIGENGQGKTNILEAINLCLTGQTFRIAKSEHFVRHGEDYAFVEAEINFKNITNKVKIELSKTKRKIKLNEKSLSAQKLASHFPVVMFSPESLQAIKSGPEERRKLIDELLAMGNINHSLLIEEFNHCLKSRNKLLKDQLQGEMTKNTFEDVFSSLNTSFLSLATKLSTARILGINLLQNEFNFTAKSILDEKNVDYSVDYLISGKSALQWSEKEVYYSLLKRCEELKVAEIASGRTLVGPQRHEIQFLFDNVEARYYSSQGQQRALILAFKMTQINYHYKGHGRYPLLLLDDVLSELDPKRRNCLIAFLKSLKSQIILTATDLHFPKSFGNHRISIFKVNQGESFCNVQ